MAQSRRLCSIFAGGASEVVAGPGGKRSGYPSARTAIILLVLAGLAVPMMGRLLSEIHSIAAFRLPLVICAMTLCMLLGGHVTPYLAVGAGMLGQLAFMAVRSGRPFGPSVTAALLEGQWSAGVWVGVAIIMGHLAGALRMQCGKLWRWHTKSNIRLLFRRPGVILRAYRWPLAVMVLGTTLDTLTTMAFMYSTGPGTELHPAMRMMAEEFGVTVGVPLASLARMAFVLFVACVWRRWCGWLLTICGVLYILAACSNHFGWLVSFQTRLAQG